MPSIIIIIVAKIVAVNGHMNTFGKWAGLGCAKRRRGGGGVLWMLRWVLSGLKGCHFKLAANVRWSLEAKWVAFFSEAPLMRPQPHTKPQFHANFHKDHARFAAPALLPPTFQAFHFFRTLFLHFWNACLVKFSLCCCSIFSMLHQKQVPANFPATPTFSHFSRQTKQM